MNTGVGYGRRGYSWGKSVANFKKSGRFKFVKDGSGHRAGEAWGDDKDIDPNSLQRRYSKNSPSFDEGVLLSKLKRKMMDKMSHSFVYLGGK